jgi:ADP-heptose:LPS heptosyltransferase
MKFKRIAKSLWHVFLFCAEHVVFLCPPGKVWEVKELLVIKPDKLGDFVVWLDSAREYVECFDDSRRVLVAEAHWSKLAEITDFWDEVIPVDVGQFREHLFYRLKILLRIRRRQTSIVINASVRRTFRVSDVFARFSGASEKIGMTGAETREGVAWIQCWSDKWYSQLVATDNEVTYGEMGKQLSLTRVFGGGQRKAALPRMPLPATIPVPERCPDGKYMVIVLGAAGTDRRWPVTSFVEIARRFLDESDYSIVLCGARAERELSSSFLALLDSARRTRIVDLIGATNVVELVGVLRDAVAVLSNDTGAMHLAVALGRPTVCVAGVGDFGHLVPYPAELEITGLPAPVTVYEKLPCYGCGWKCIHEVVDGAPVPCVSAVSVEAVWRNLIALLKQEHGMGLGHGWLFQ